MDAFSENTIELSSSCSYSVQEPGAPYENFPVTIFNSKPIAVQNRYLYQAMENPTAFIVKICINFFHLCACSMFENIFIIISNFICVPNYALILIRSVIRESGSAKLSF